MNLFNHVFGWFSSANDDDLPDTNCLLSPDINPATGLPMLDEGLGGVDVGGSPFGFDIHEDSGPGVDMDFGTNDSDWP